MGTNGDDVGTEVADIVFTENSCTAKTAESDWTALGCTVDTATATKVSALGTVGAANNYASCTITCPTDGSAFVVDAVKECTAKSAASDWTALGYTVQNPTANTVAGLGTVSAATNYPSCTITCPTAGSAFVVDATENTCTAKSAESDWTALGCTVTTATATKVSLLGSITAADDYASCDVTCPTDGEAFSVTSVPECTPKADDAAWAAVGCDVTTPAAITVAGLGTVTAATNYASCEITCPTAGGAFSVASVPECTAKADAAAWAAVGCVVDGTQNGTTVASLGNVTAATGYTSCAITCPTAGGAFAVDAVAVTTTAAPISGASTGAVWSAMVTLLALMGVSSLL